MQQPSSHSPLPPAPADFSDNDDIGHRAVIDRHDNSDHVNKHKARNTADVARHKQWEENHLNVEEGAADFTQMYGSVSKPHKDMNVAMEMESKMQRHPVKPPRRNRPPLDNVVSIYTFEPFSAIYSQIHRIPLKCFTVRHRTSLKTLIQRAQCKSMICFWYFLLYHPSLRRNVS